MNEQHHDVQSGASAPDFDDTQFARAVGVLASAVRRLADEDPAVRRAIRVVADAVDAGDRRHGSSGASQAPSSRRGGVGLDLVAQRASVKAQACRTRAGAAEAPDAQSLQRDARSLRGCWLWMLQHEGESLSTDTAARMAEIYENLALAASYVQGIALNDAPDAETTANAYKLLAEAQSALWVALTECDVQRDQDQIDAFIWLRERTRDERVYLDRFMRREDPADPAQWGELRERIESASGSDAPAEVVVRDLGAMSVS